MSRFSELAAALIEADGIAVYTHTNMDGDAAGSSAALCAVMRKLGKRCSVVMEDEVPGYLRFLENAEDPYFVSDPGFAPDLSAAVDIGEEQRLGMRSALFHSAPRSIVIDHHEGEPDIGDIAVRDPGSAAAACLVYELIRELEAQSGRQLIDKETAEALYVGVVTDTGSFRYSNSDKNSLEVTLALYDYGIDYSGICNRIYNSYPMSQLRLEGRVLSNAEIFAGGKAVISACLLADLEAVGAEEDQTDTCIDRLRSIEGVEVAALIKEKEEGFFKLSMRSKDYVNVAKLCAEFGGGGHERAAGAHFHEALSSCWPKVKEACIKALSEADS